ncbi:LGFP repeat-containing protein [Mycobacterium sp. LTG2003]
MTRPGARLNTAVRRMTVGVLAVGLAGLLAPTASATPESDADAAITSAWDVSGGDGGPLGARQGGVYAVGPGFGQNFAAGKMFFTPDTGAHYVQGAILEKYESLGGPADGDLGFPTIDEGAGRAPDSRNSTFSAADKPVIFWTPATGARVVRGAINAAWDKLGGSAGVLGVPAEDETYDGDVVSQKFTAGELSWNRKTKAFTTVPPELVDQLAGLQVPDDPTSAIDAARRAAGGALGPLGAKDGDQYPIGNAGGLGQNFAGGKIFYSPETGANVVTGQVLEKYESVGGPQGDLGFPTSSETEGGLGPNSRVSTFAAADKPVIFWTPDYGAVIVRGAMNAAWEKLGGATGTLGAPMADQTEDGSVVTQRFSGGAISWDRSDNTFTTEPPNLATELAGLEIPGLTQSPQAGSPQASDDNESKPFSWQWNWWWLLALIPVLLLAGLIVGAALWHRRRDRDDDGFDHDPFGDDHYDDDDRYPGRDYDEGRYESSHYDESRFADDTYADDRGGDRTSPYQPTADYQGAETPTSRLVAEPYRDTATGESPFDGPTDASMPVSQWAAPGGFGSREDDEDELPEESAELVDTHSDEEDFDEDEYDDRDEFVDGDELDEDEDLEDIGDLDEQDRLDDEADFDDEDDLDEVGDLQREDQNLRPAPGIPSSLIAGVPAAAAFSANDDQDDIDTAPTRVVTEADLRSSGPPSGRHAAIELDEPVPSATAIHLPLDDPQRAPQGYPIKADTKSGLYWSPDSSQYDDAIAEIWFASEEFARTNGFVRAD